MQRLLSAAVLSVGIFQCACAASPVNLAEVGFLRFENSGAPAAQDNFLRGVATLHSFGWKQSIAQFKAAQAI